MNAILKRHSLTIANQRTSVSLEGVFWEHFKQMAKDRGLSTAALAYKIDMQRLTAPGKQNLSSAIRCEVVADLERKLEAATRWAEKGQAA
jgi:predicted DNA-binding ribbon-helix-helix protein